MQQLTQRFWICCVSVGVSKILSLLFLFLISLLATGIWALLWANGTTVGWIGSIYFFVYALIAVGIVMFAVAVVTKWCRRGRQKRANSGTDLPAIESEV